MAAVQIVAGLRSSAPRVCALLHALLAIFLFLNFFSGFPASLPFRPHPRHTVDAHTDFYKTQHTALHLRVSVIAAAHAAQSFTCVKPSR